MGRNWQKTVGISAAVLGVAAVLAVSLSMLPGGGSGDGGREGAAQQTPGAESPSDKPPGPTGPARVGPEPSTIPEVRDWKPVRGPGFEPGKHTRVVADSEGPLADEARLLARELNVEHASGPAHTGDIELRQDPDADTGREGYVLTSRAGQVKITGADDAGVFYGTRTLLQTIRATGQFADGTVRDRPDRPQRGFMLDIARKHYSAEWIESRVREMGDLKLNQLQLHLSDDQAFGVESDSHPEVVSDPHLTKEQLRRIIKLAASRHIKVIPEIDSPGHLGSVIEEHPDLQLESASGDPAEGAVDISRPKAARVVDDLLREYADLFPAKRFHLGGDEYQALMAEDPEASYPNLAAEAKERYGSSGKVQDLTTDWLNDRAETVRKEGKIPQLWNDGMHSGGEAQPDREREVAYWTGKESGEREPEDFLDEGWKLVNLNDEYLYYVLGEPNDFSYPTGKRIYREWTPAVVRGTEPVPEKWRGPHHILGGRFAVWGDIPDAQSEGEIAGGIRLPLMATSQKLWNPEKPGRSWEEFRKLADRVE